MSIRTQRGNQSNDDAQHAFALSFTALSLMLLAFFVYLSTQAAANPERMREILTSIAEGAGGQVALSTSKPQEELLQRLTTAAGKLPNAYTERRGSTLFIRIPASDLFRNGDDQIRAESLQQLDPLTKHVASSNAEVQIHAHTDDIAPPSSRYASNWDLSIARAATLFRLFVDTGSDTARIWAEGHGESKPRTLGSSPIARSENRRIEFFMKVDDH